MKSVVARGQGSPDYAQSVSNTPLAAPLVDQDQIRELAKRVNGFPSLDRRGDVILWEDFESGLGTKVVWTGGGTMSITIGSSNTGSFAARHTGGGGVLAGNTATMRLPYRGKSKIGFEFFFKPISATDFFPDNASGITAEIDIKLADGVNLIDFGIQAQARVKGNTDYAYSSNRMDLMLADGVHSDPIAEAIVNTPAGPGRYINCKLVGDFLNKKYTRLIFDGVEYNLSKYTPAVTASVLKYLEVTLVITGPWGALASSVIDLDDFIITENEPAN